MRVLGSLLIAVIVGILAIWLIFELLVGVIKLVGILIGIGLAVGTYFVAEKLIGKGR